MSVERRDAGESLARVLSGTGERTGSVVVGIPKGGAIVGAQVAAELRAAYECVPVCRIGMPCFPDLTLGAIDPDGLAVFEPRTQLTRHEITRSFGALADHLAEQVARCRGDRAPIDLAGRDVIVVDDSADTHVVAQAAAEYLRRKGAARLTFATPVATDGVAAKLRELYDEVVIEATRSSAAVSGFYGGVAPTEEEVHDCLVRAWETAT